MIQLELKILHIRNTAEIQIFDSHQPIPEDGVFVHNCDKNDFSSFPSYHDTLQTQNLNSLSSRQLVYNTLSVHNNDDAINLPNYYTHNLSQALFASTSL